MIKLNHVPKWDFIVGRVVDVNKSETGLALPETKTQGLTLFCKVDAVGPDVNSCKPGDIILYFRCSHVWLRDGTHAIVVKDTEVLTVIEDLDLSRCTIEGESRPPEPSRLVSVQ